MLKELEALDREGMTINRRRKRAIDKVRKEIDQYEDWKEWVLAVGGQLIKDENGKYRGIGRYE